MSKPLLTLLLSGACLLSPWAAQAAVPQGGAARSVDWVKPQGTDMAPIFAQARAERKPVFLYWGAVWCPPCNQVKATVFNRPDFIERSRWFVPVYLDGDTPGAQKLGAQFKVRGYPTMILLAPDGHEITRLPGEVDARTYMDVLSAGLASAGGVKETLARSLGAERAKLGPADWRLLGYYAWEQDEGQVVAAQDLAATLWQLAMAAPASQGSVRSRLLLKSVVASKMQSQPVGAPAAALQGLRQVLGNAGQANANADVLINYAAELVGALTPAQSASRDELTVAFDRVLQKLAVDPRLSRMDRLGAVAAQVALAKLSHANDAASPVARWTVAPALLQRVRRAVGEVRPANLTAHERQALVPAAADLLSEVQLWDESEALLLAEMPQAVSPYYHMLILSANARARGDNTTALNWSEKAWGAAQGGATRLQWGVGFVSRLLELAPGETARIEAAAATLLGEVDPVPESFYERNRRGLERLGKKLNGWAQSPEQRAALQRLLVQWQGVCTKLPQQDESRRVCDAALGKGAG